MTKLNELYKQGKISKIHFLIYAIFATMPEGNELLKELTELVLMSDPTSRRVEDSLWNDGRRSFLRDIKLIIMDVNKILDGVNNDRPRNIEFN